MSKGYESPPKSCEVLGIGFFDFEKITFLEIFDMHLVVFVIFSQYLGIYSQYLINIWSSGLIPPMIPMSKELL